MKQLYEEIHRISNWCSCCPHTDLRRGVGKYRKNNSDHESFQGILPIERKPLPFIETFFSTERITDAILQAMNVLPESDTAPTEELTEPDEPSPEEKAKQEWEDWESNYELTMESHHYLSCYYLNHRQLTINLDREIIIPDDDREILRILDKLSSCYTEECLFNRVEIKRWGSVDNAFRTALAKIDFALIEAGKDYGKLMSDMYFPYYERSKDITECGYSRDLIRYYMEKYGFQMMSNEEYDAISMKKQDRHYERTQEFQDAFQDGKCDANGVLLIKKAEYTRYATEKYDIKSSYKSNWQRFDQIFTDKDGKVISYKSFMQSYRDQGLG